MRVATGVPFPARVASPLPCPLRVSGHVQHVEYAEMPLVLVIKRREIFRRVQRELIDVKALADGRLRHRGRYQHFGPKETGCNNESRREPEKLVCHSFVS